MEKARPRHYPFQNRGQHDTGDKDHLDPKRYRSSQSKRTAVLTFFATNTLTGPGAAGLPARLQSSLKPS